MSVSIREELLFYVEKLAAIHQDQRLGQLVCNLVSLVDLAPEALWSTDDASLCREVETHYEHQLSRLGRPEPPPLRSGRRWDLLVALRGHLAERPEKPLARSIGDLVTGHPPVVLGAARSALVWDISDDDLLRLLRDAADRSPDLRRGPTRQRIGRDR